MNEPSAGQWVHVDERLPSMGGKYIVVTLGTHRSYQTKGRFEARYFYDEEKKTGSFDVNNQTVVMWLDESIYSSPSHS